MEEDRIENYKLNYYMEKCGMNNRYQYITLLIIFLLNGTSEFLATTIPLLEITPVVKYYSEAKKDFVIEQATYKLCNETLKYAKYSIVEDMSKTSLVKDFDIFCNKDKVSLIGISLFLGVTLGYLISYIFSDKIGRKKTIILFSTLYAINQIVYIFIGNEYLLYALLLLSGMFYSITILASFLLMNEVIDTTLTAIFRTIIYNSVPFFGILFTFLFKEINDWKVIFTVIAIVQILTTIIFAIFIEESPRFHFAHGDLESLKKVLMQISKINNTGFCTDQIDFLIEKNKKTQTPEKEDSPFGKSLISEFNKFEDDLEKDSKGFFISLFMYLISKNKCFIFCIFSIFVLIVCTVYIVFRHF